MNLALADPSLPRLEKYEIVEEVGHGGMATVYRARDRRLDREVAIKLIHRHLRQNPEVLARFVAEAKAVAKLRHPNIVEVYDVSGEDDAERFLVVELVRGASLRKILEEHRHFPPEIGAAIALELAEALAHAHSLGIIHRDIKPENVLVETEGEGADPQIKLTDFGIAKILDAQGVTSTGQVLGSPAHMAPEQIEGEAVDARADIFGLGVLLYELWVGKLPFEGANPAQVLRRVLEGVYTSPERERPTVGGRWAQILKLALAKDPEQRYPSAEAFAEALRGELLFLGIDDSRAELRAYFTDPEGYLEEAPARLVAILTERGEQARNAGDRLGAAADFNRALAYAPDDPALMQQIARLSRGRTRRRLVATLAASLGGLGLLSSLAYAGYWAISSPATTAEVPQRPAREPPPSVEEPEAPAPEPIPAAPPSAQPAAKAPVKPAATSARVTLPPARRREPTQTTRPVRFELSPKGAWVSIDGSAPEDLFGQAKALSVGSHLVTLTVPNSSCCAPTSHRIEVREGEGTQRFGLAVNFREARLTTQGAPERARLRCPALHIEGPATRTFAVKMTSLEITATCWIDAPSLPTQAVSTRLRAGETATLAWR